MRIKVYESMHTFLYFTLFREINEKQVPKRMQWVRQAYRVSEKMFFNAVVFIYFYFRASSSMTKTSQVYGTARALEDF